MVESYFDGIYISQAKTKETEITPLVKSLSGVVQLDKNQDHKTAYAKYLIEKYNRNLKDFKKSKLPVMTATQFLKNFLNEKPIEE
jgi:hypothetical protein